MILSTYPRTKAMSAENQWIRSSIFLFFFCGVGGIIWTICLTVKTKFNLDPNSTFKLWKISIKEDKTIWWVGQAKNASPWYKRDNDGQQSNKIRSNSRTSKCKTVRMESITARTPIIAVHAKTSHVINLIILPAIMLALRFRQSVNKRK